jgi:hypothetical protein
MRSFAALSIALLVLVIAVDASSAENRQAMSPKHEAVPASLRARWLAAGRSVAGTPQQQLLDAVAAGFPAGDIVSASIGTPSGSFQPAPTIDEVGTAWLNVTVKAADQNYGRAYATWEAQLLAGAFREASHTMGLPDLLGVTTTLQYPDGTTSSPWSNAIGQPFGKTVASLADATKAINAALSSDPRFAPGSSVHFIKPLDGAAVIDVKLAHPADFPGGSSVAMALLGDPNKYEGVFIRVTDPAGKLLRVAGYATFTGVGIGESTPGNEEGIPLGPSSAPDGPATG